jgi:hypothetical protein
LVLVVLLDKTLLLERQVQTPCLVLLLLLAVRVAVFLALI